PSPAPALPPTPASGGGTFPQLRRGTNPEKTNSERGFGSLHPLQLYPLPPPPAAVPSPSSAGGLIPKRRTRNEGSIPFTRSSSTPTPASGGGTFPQLRRGTDPEKTNSERGD